MSRRTVISPNNAVGNRTGLLKVYKAAPAAAVDVVPGGPVMTAVVLACAEVSGGTDD